MYAVLVTGGKQYRVAQGETLRVEKLEAEAGNEITFDNILMLGDSDGITIGDALKGASVTAKVVGHGRADKVRIIKFRRRKHHMKRQGHRQHYTEIEITGIAGGSKEKQSWHKEGRRFSRNGRDSNPKYLGVKIYGRPSTPATSSSASAAPSSTRAWQPAFAPRPHAVRVDRRHGGVLHQGPEERRTVRWSPKRKLRTMRAKAPAACGAFRLCWRASSSLHIPRAP